MTTVTAGQSATVTIPTGTAWSVTTSGEAQVHLVSGRSGAGFQSWRVTPDKPLALAPFNDGGAIRIVGVSGTTTDAARASETLTPAQVAATQALLVSGAGNIPNAYKLRRSMSRIGQAFARQASIGVFGHSVVAGAYANDVVSVTSPADLTWNSVGWVGVLRRILAARYGVASLGGMLNPAENFSTNFTLGGGASQTAINLSAGLAGCRVNLAAAADTVTVAGTGRYLRVFGYALAAGTKGRYTVDGGSLTTDPGAGAAGVTPSGSQYWYTWDIDCGTDAAHTVVLQGAASGSWYMWGACFMSQTTSGVLVHRLGKSGAVLPDIVASSLDATDTAGPAWRTTLNDVGKTQQLEAVTTRLGLDLAICMVDANDVSGGWSSYGYTLADIRRHAANFANRVTALGIDVLFVTGPQRDPAAYAAGCPFTQDEAIAQYKSVADSMDRCAHLDLTLAYPTYAGANADGLMIDTVHPTSRGHGWMGARVAQALLAAA